MRRAWITVSLLLSSAASAGEYGYSLLDQRSQSEISQSARGLEGRINFGGNTDHYSGDRWSLALGIVKAREPDGDGWIDTPAGCCGYSERIDSYSYMSFTLRWFTRYGRFSVAPRLRFFVGTGVAWRNAETCVSERAGDPERCFSGTPAVSSKWTFHQSFGFKWREIVEVAWEHDSTGRISDLNHGDDVIRFTLFPLFLGNNARLR